MVGQAGAASHGGLGAFELARDEFARRWAAFVGPTVPVGQHELRETLAEFTDELHAAMVRDPYPAGAVHQVGRSLVEHGFVSVATLEKSLVFLGEHLPDHFELSGDRSHRLMSLLGGIAAGYGEALRDRTLEQQELAQAAAFRSIRDAESALRASEAKFRAVFRTSAVAIALTGMASELLDFNDALLNMLGYSAEELASLNAQDIVHPGDQPTVATLREALRSGAREHVRAELRLLCKDGDYLDVLIAVALVRDEAGEPAYHVTMIESLDEVRALQSQLVRQSLNDVHTGLANRPQFLGWLESTVGTKGPASLALVAFDIDGFRVVNDAFGHDVGNRLLTVVAGHLRTVFGGVGQLARIGPDEFGVLIRDPADIPAVVALAEEAVDLLAEPVWVGDHGIGVTASVGIVLQPARGGDAAELMRCLDVTLRWAKDDGKAQWALYDRSRDQRDRERLVLAASIAGGLEQGEFRVDYEPVYALAGRSLIAVEARLGWDHPEHGLLDPQSLASLSACTGMAVRLGRWAMEQACRQAGAWYAEFGPRAPVLTMDLTARQCQEPELVAEVRRILREAALPASMLRFELAEQLPALINEDQAEELDILAGHGVRFVLDQVGGGNIPVDKLRRIPLHGLTFQGFPVHGLAEGSNRLDESAAVALLGWARTLGLPLYAAGVGTAYEARRLAELGVTGAQGPLFGAGPLTADEVRRVLGRA
ncbi:diguanylate cyclase (GGDEF)-like protein/PAS domain S-box-containing protein [Saccharothrix tamanrassetensis]|uniref:Diguanylate cyclase (GGDEF)-like protein/PAS domain S-box-containing protein n=1 Tax=Saccharothrix tamanrassetensis TaxID=1051531 RepID=A0A841CSN8_9PSEU|nr:EAL domain-containing protein [Saccharothrix tamanrassetensis]MBB5960280.1 diguanylate cyclase (GGDEF)-like protein/PAS domain S-box-containing protein [Saccharothrix tamanrassetensis]